MTKRLVASLLALIVVLSLCCFGAFAEEDSQESVDNASTESVVSEAETSDDASEDESEDASKDASEDASKADESDTSDVSSTTSATTSDTSSTDTASTGSKTPWGLFVFLGLCLIFVIVCIICVKENNPFGQRVSKFLRDYKSEFKKITWLGPKDLLKQTALVLVVLIAAAAVLGLLDWVFSSLINLLVNI